MTPQVRPVALVTGASRGVGAAIARALAPTHDLILGGRGSSELDALATEFDGAVTLPVDLTDDDTLEAAVETITDLDVLVHSAGIASTLEMVADTPVEEWRALLDINVVAAAELTRLLLPALRVRRGHIVFLNSGAGQQVRPGWTPYAASKFALRALADGVRAEEPELRVTSIYPGRIDTDMQREIVAREGNRYDPARYLTPSTVATAVVQAIAAPADAHPTDLTLRPRG
ncbi:MAG: SDR family oxidoreductase [Gordonia sp. (in: high G+C Gram-positive bacteria)]|uniref:SDR family oxidoreductase n=1 Tax=Gordonia sp. (in: high G+C Gram-positive bacteria) TaxID=84139 RepID=UPI003BB601FA